MGTGLKAVFAIAVGCIVALVFSLYFSGVTNLKVGTVYLEVDYSDHWNATIIENGKEKA